MNKETLEEAAINHSSIMFEHEVCDSNVSFKAGVKWERENSNVDVLGFEIATLKSLITDMDTTIKCKCGSTKINTTIKEKPFCFLCGKDIQAE